MKKYRIFVSHATKDFSKARMIEEKIKYCMEDESCNLDIFMASKSIEKSEKWLNSIKNSILESDFIIVLWTPNSDSSIFQHYEIGASWIVNKPIYLITSNYDHGKLPQIIRNIQAISIREFLDDECRSLVRRMR